MKNALICKISWKIKFLELFELKKKKFFSLKMTWVNTSPHYKVNSSLFWSLRLIFFSLRKSRILCVRETGLGALGTSKWKKIKVWADLEIKNNSDLLSFLGRKSASCKKGITSVDWQIRRMTNQINKLPRTN